MSVEARQKRRRFMRGLYAGIRVVWPILSGLLALMVGLGLLVGLFEGWSLQESAYFSFVTGLTIGYGDFAPKTLIGRVLSVCIGFCGLLTTALLAAVAVKALDSGQDGRNA